MIVPSELATLLTITEGIVNSRPLSITRNTDDQKVITPAILAINRDIKSITPYKFDKDSNIPQLRSCKDVNRRKKYLDLLHTQLLRKWVEEYIYSLTLFYLGYFFPGFYLGGGANLPYP